LPQSLNEEDVKTFLQKIGFRKYEIQAYLALIKNGPQEYTGLIKLSGVPYGKIYTTMGALAQKGWAKSSKDRPKIFYPVDPERALKNHLERIRKTIREQEEAYTRISPRLRTVGKNPNGRKNVYPSKPPENQEKQ